MRLIDVWYNRPWRAASTRSAYGEAASTSGTLVRRVR